MTKKNVLIVRVLITQQVRKYSFYDFKYYLIKN